MHLSDKILAFRYSVLTRVYGASLPDVAFAVNECSMHLQVGSHTRLQPCISIKALLGKFVQHW